MDGLVTRRSIEEGETAVLGTMNNAGSVLLTIADMSMLEAEVEVDETEIPTVTARTDGEGHDRRRAGPDVQGPRHRGRQQPDSDLDAEHRTAAGDDLQGGDHPRRGGARREAGLHLHGRDHDGDAQERRLGADPGAHRPRDALQRQERDGARDAAAAAARRNASRRRFRRRTSRLPVTRARKRKASSSSPTAAASSRRSRSALPASSTSKC